ncbi:hypothetical protein AK812_SmicGene946 [Symbiodinium microadriaticum]|uniref:Response regulatory domain-containing protein n=1 Tax=Symbiodinium microadriaticum TaxID=2951 RepID=A0A1Q9F5E2_SYMMI|nr:hypothetical protein AK812_SmicGene946 [Symbiodinium microadriaticum]
MASSASSSADGDGVEAPGSLTTPRVVMLSGSRAKGFDDAEALVEEAAFDLVLCDLDLASALLEKLATPSGRLSLSVVLVCPKRMDKRLLASCLDKGARGYVAKPLRVQAIRGVLLRYATPEEDSVSSPAGSSAAAHYERVVKHTNSRTVAAWLCIDLFISLVERVAALLESGQMSIRVLVTLLSGRTAEDSSVEHLRRRAQCELGVGLEELITAFGVVLAASTTLEAAEIRDGETLTARVRGPKLASTTGAFAHLGTDGSVVSWGNPALGGDSRMAQEELYDIVEIQASKCAFAALRADGLVFTWGDAAKGGDCSPVQESLQHVLKLQASGYAFAAILSNGSVVTWGHPLGGGDSSAIRERLQNVQQVQSTNAAFAAVLRDGSVVTWGMPHHGGDSRRVEEQLRDVQEIQATHCAFAAIRKDGSVVTWGEAPYGGDCSSVQGQLREVKRITAGRCAFAAILSDASVVTWGDLSNGGDSSSVQAQLQKVCCVQSTDFAFAALLENGSVVTWGDEHNGGVSSAVQHQLRNVQAVQASDCAFAALRFDGTVVTWGSHLYGGESSRVQCHLHDVTSIQASAIGFAATCDGAIVTWPGSFHEGGGYLSTGNVLHIQATAKAFAALLTDGSLVTWGDSRAGGDSSCVQEKLRTCTRPGARPTVPKRPRLL